MPDEKHKKQDVLRYTALQLASVERELNPAERQEMEEVRARLEPLP